MGCIGMYWNYFVRGHRMTQSYQIWQENWPIDGRRRFLWHRPFPPSDRGCIGSPLWNCSAIDGVIRSKSQVFKYLF